MTTRKQCLLDMAREFYIWTYSGWDSMCKTSQYQARINHSRMGGGGEWQELSNMNLVWILWGHKVIIRAERWVVSWMGLMLIGTGPKAMCGVTLVQDAFVLSGIRKIISHGLCFSLLGTLLLHVPNELPSPTFYILYYFRIAQLFFWQEKKKG